MTWDEGELPAWRVLGPVMDLVTPMAVRVVATLRVADLMAGGVERVDELAERAGVDVDALGRVLRHLACKGVFVESSPGRFVCSELGELLRTDHPSGVWMLLDLDGFGGRMDLAFTGLMHTVRTGQPAWETVFGAPYWDYLDANPALAASFDAMMAGSRRHVLAAAYDWSGVRHVVDVGGGTGATLAEVLDAHPDLRGTLVDLPSTVERGRVLMAERGLDERCEFSGQSFFESLPGGADVYLLSRVLHDWGDEPATAILRRCAEAAGETGRVLIVETDEARGDAGFVEMDLRMLVLCGGRERSADDYVVLAQAAGLTIVDIRKIPSYALIECRVA